MWKLDALKKGTAKVAYNNSVVYVETLRDMANGANSGSVITVDAVTGAERWRKTIEDDNEVYKAGMSYANVMVYVSTHGGMYALDVLSGAKQWRHTGSVCGER